MGKNIRNAILLLLVTAVVVTALVLLVFGCDKSGPPSIDAPAKTQRADSSSEIVARMQKKYWWIKFDWHRQTGWQIKTWQDVGGIASEVHEVQDDTFLGALRKAEKGKQP